MFATKQLHTFITMRHILLSTLVSAVLLFLWSGLSQVFPWGVPTAQTVSTGSAENFQAPNLIQLPAGSLTTPGFDAQFVNRVSTLTTEVTFSWIVSKPLTYYQPGAYFLREALTQLLVGFCLALLLHLSVSLRQRRRWALVGVAALAGIIAQVGPLMNWWGLPPAYALGTAANLLIGWLLVAWVSARWFIRPAQA